MLKICIYDFPRFLDIEENGVNGLLAKYVDPNGTLGRDGRVHAGDYLVKVNGQNMKNISHEEALNILKQTHLIPLNHEISITYIPATDAAVFKTSAITRLAESEAVEAVLKTCEERPTPAARTSTPSSATSTSERRKKASTIISIGASAPLVSPEADIDKEDTANVKAIYIKATTEDESTTDPPTVEGGAHATPPPPPPRPSKASASSSASSSVENSPKHVLGSAKLQIGGGGHQEELETRASEASLASQGGQGSRELSDVVSLQDDETSVGFSSQRWGKPLYCL